MKIYTKKGDTGTTQLIGGTRVPKHDLRIESYGTIDELNSWIGLLGARLNNEHQKAFLKEIQDRLFTIGSMLSSDPQKSRMKIPDLHDEDVSLLEREIDAMTAVLPEMKSFILPGGNESNAICHITRCVCRRAERLAVSLDGEEKIAPLILMYLNRLSDYLFVLSRKITYDAGSEEIPWKARL